jgi:hypothetical protein
MSAAGYFVAAVGVSAGLTILAVGVLLRPMSNVLTELCGSRRRGDFWVTLTCLCLLLAATAAATLPDSTLRRSLTETHALLLNAVLQCAAGLAGVLLSLLMLVGALVLFIRRFEERFASTTPLGPRDAGSGPAGREASLPSSERPSYADLDTFARLRLRKRQLFSGDDIR